MGNYNANLGHAVSDRYLLFTQFSYLHYENTGKEKKISKKQNKIVNKQ